MESMRLNPTVISTSRNLAKTLNLDGFTIPAGFRIIKPLTKILVDERNFERAKSLFLNDGCDGAKKRTHGEVVSAADPANFIAFSDGARDCVGKRLAMNEATMAVAFLMKHFRVAYDETKPLDAKRRLTSWFPHELQIKFLLRDK